MILNWLCLDAVDIRNCFNKIIKEGNDIAALLSNTTANWMGQCHFSWFIKIGNSRKTTTDFYLHMGLRYLSHFTPWNKRRSPLDSGIWHLQSLAGLEAGPKKLQFSKLLPSFHTTFQTHRFGWAGVKFYSNTRENIKLSFEIWLGKIDHTK